MTDRSGEETPSRWSPRAEGETASGGEALSREALADIRARLAERSGRILHHTSVYFGTLLLSKAIVFGFTLYLARAIGARGLGIFAVGAALAGFLATLGLYGLPQTAVRYASVYRSRGQTARLRHFVTRSTTLVVASGLALGLLLFLARGPVASLLLGREELARYLPAFAGAVLLQQIYRLGRETLRGLEAVDRMALIDLFGLVGTRVLATVVFVTLGYGLWGYVGGYLLSLTVAAVLLHRAVRFRVGSRARPARRAGLGVEVHVFARYALGASLVAVLIQRGDRILLGGFASAGAIGVYEVAMTVAATLTLGLTALSAILSPVIAGLHETGERRTVGVLAERANKWVTTFTFPAAVGVCAFAPGVMGFFGDAFVSGWPVLVVLTASRMIDVGMGSVGLLLSMSGHQREEFRAVGLAAISMVLLDLLLIPLWGTVGAAFGFLVAVTLQNLFRLVRVRRLLGVDPVGPEYRRILPWMALSGAVMLGFSRWIDGALGGWALPLALTAVLGYALSVGLVWRLSADELDRLMLGRVRALLHGLPGGRR